MTTAILVLSILTSSFLGSWHCAAMCGPVATLMAQRNSLLAYHLGRGLSYIALGSLAGYLGQFFLQSQFITLRWISSIVLAMTLLAMGLAMIIPTMKSQLTHQISQKLALLFRKFNIFKTDTSGFTVGVLTAFLPCGWLYTYLLAAVATKSSFSGGLLMALFWLGGLPAFGAITSMVKTLISSAKIRQQRIAGGVLIVAGLYSIASFLFLHS